jgi:hypothetical protein
VTLLDFILTVGSGDLSMFYFTTHTSELGMAVEFFEYSENGQDARDNRYNYYLYTMGYNPDWIDVGNATGYGYFIGVTTAGLQHWCTDLEETMVFGHGCCSSSLVSYWNNPLVYCGFNSYVPMSFW